MSESTTKEINFICPCPMLGCKNANKKFQWLHENCGGKETINEKGIIRCSKCHKSGLLNNWKFDCGNHMKKEKSNLIGCLNALSKLHVDKKNEILISKIIGSVSKYFNSPINN